MALSKLRALINRALIASHGLFYNLPFCEGFADKFYKNIKSQF